MEIAAGGRGASRRGRKDCGRGPYGSRCLKAGIFVGLPAGIFVVGERLWRLRPGASEPPGGDGKRVAEDVKESEPPGGAGKMERNRRWTGPDIKLNVLEPVL